MNANRPQLPRKYGLLGWPVKHSVSPEMQGAGFRALGLEATYELLPVEPAQVAAKVAELKAAGYRGWNVTVPHKGAMYELVDEAEPAAAHAESVNTVRVDGNRLQGWSTDGYGLEKATEEAFGVGVESGSFVFWGTGGAARATSIHFALEGAAAITLVNRTVARAEALAAKLSAISPACRLTVLAPGDVRELAADAVYQCTSVGLHQGDPCAIPPKLLRPDLRVMDMIYRPTKLLTEARSRGCQVADGRGMLLHQGVRSLALWTDREPPVEAMRHGLESALS